MIPYQRRRGTNQRWPVSVTMGVTSRHRNRLTAAPVPSVSSTDTEKVFWIQREERRHHQDEGDQRGGAEDDKCHRLPLDAGAAELEVHLHPFI